LFGNPALFILINHKNPSPEALPFFVPRLTLLGFGIFIFFNPKQDEKSIKNYGGLIHDCSMALSQVGNYPPAGEASDASVILIFSH
jgi:hypothetical protein